MAQTDNTKKCPVCGNSFTGRAKHCSESCKMKAKRQKATSDKLAYVRYSPLVETIIRNAVRAGTLAVIAGVDLFELNREINRHRDLCWRTGQQLHISHYTASNDHGSLSPANFGVWPAWLNYRQGRASLPIGHRISDRHWHDSGMFCSSEEEAWRLILKKHRATLIKLAESKDDTLRKPSRQDIYTRLKRAGYKGSFVTVHRMDKKAFANLCGKYSVKVPDYKEPADSDRVTIRELLIAELCRQRKFYPDLQHNIDQVTDSHRNYPEWLATEILALAVTHNYEKAFQTMADYIPNKPVIKHQNDREKWPVEIHTWRGDDGKWHETEVPHPDFYKYNSLDF